MKTVFLPTGNNGKLVEFKFSLNNQANVVGLRDLNLNDASVFGEASENFDSFLMNGFSKLAHASRFLNERDIKIHVEEILVDDSGLCVPALNFLPGVHSASIAGLPRSDEKNRKYLADKVAHSPSSRNIGDEKRLDAFFVCFLLSMQEDSFLFIEKENLWQSSEIESVERNFFNMAVSAISNNQPSGFSHKKVPLKFFLKECPSDHNVDVYFGFCCGEVSTKEQQLLAGAGHGYDSLFYPLQTPQKSFSSISLEEKNRLSHRGQALNAYQAQIKT